jgi:AcrR family transcriptional regulator
VWTATGNPAAANRAQIAAAARTLFAGRGYVATTISAIAESADIPAPTIYSAFGSKANILREIADQLVATLDVNRAHELARADPDAARGLRAAAAIQRRQYELMYDVIEVYLEAARTDPEIAVAANRIAANREEAFGRHIEAIADRLGAVTVDDGLSVYLALVLPEVWGTLVAERGWPPEKYETWLGDSLVATLLGE